MRELEQLANLFDVQATRASPHLASAVPDLKDGKGQTALHYAARMNDHLAIKLLLCHPSIDIDEGDWMPEDQIKYDGCTREIFSVYRDVGQARFRILFV